ncbi:hypothetical protein [Synechococcus sp. CCY 9618]|uniref:hypothetical protein n=1 Tax=Synechococcus sp. CCY 9618 TaxID=2815602 RepID=UPI001C25009C|nr:hypothetical protein [Synechococcus sp. CCY 9618]
MLSSFIRLRSSRFPILPGEDDELVNEGMYGKALAIYLTEKLPEKGYATAGYGCEDWGWWVGLAGFPFTFGVCIYGRRWEDGDLDLYVSDGAIATHRWSWRTCRFIESGAGPAAARLHSDLLSLFAADPEIHVLATDLELPFVDSSQSGE